MNRESSLEYSIMKVIFHKNTSENSNSTVECVFVYCYKHSDESVIPFFCLLSWVKCQKILSTFLAFLWWRNWTIVSIVQNRLTIKSRTLYYVNNVPPKHLKLLILFMVQLKNIVLQNSVTLCLIRDH